MRSTEIQIRILVKYPGTWVVCLQCTCSFLLFIYWFKPQPLVLAGVAAMTLGLLSLWAWMFMRSKAFMRAYLSTPTATEDENQFAELEISLEKIGFDRGLKQMLTLKEKYLTLIQIIKRRFNAGEYAYLRYIITAQHVYMASLDNLKEMEISLKSVSTVDPGEIREKTAKLHSKAKRNQTESAVLNNLNKQLELHGRQQKRVQNLFLQNEVAITAMINAATALADNKTDLGSTGLDVGSAMSELEILSKNAKQYSI